MNAVTPRQRSILDWIIAYRGKNGYSPSIREIGGEFGITSLRGVTVHLEALERKGLLTRNPGVPRGIDRGGVVAKITVYARAEVLVPKGSVEIVEKMIAETVANIGNAKVG